jgi:DNA mismatch repair protein MutL
MPKNKIILLPGSITNKIAAGEVVQRPASAVKELMENALDANAKNIDVYIKRAGKALIQVVDDGEGMNEEDAVLSIQRHATSKIREFEDLERIRTFGFRGEALSSMASVSVLEIKTETLEDEIGTLVRIDNAGEVHMEKGAFSKGTSISVKNLFYNTPARRNFLKSNSTELKHILETFKRITICYPQIHFRLYNDDDLLYDFNSGNIKERMQDIFADNILDAVIEVKEETEYVSLNGFTAKPTFMAKNRGEQYFFINNRYVVSRVVSHAVYSAYEHILEKGDYPFFVLNLTIDPAKMDINVHPQKLEVKFDDEKDIYTFIQAVIKKSLGSYDLIPNLTFGDESTPNQSKLKFGDHKPVERQDFSDRPFRDHSSGNTSPQRNIFSENEIEMLFSSINKEVTETTTGETNVSKPFDEDKINEIEHSAPDEYNESGTESTFIVALHNKYILSQIKSGLMIVDAHVAHERILYEKAIKSLETNIPFSQQLLFPQTIQVDPADFELLKEIESYLMRLGFELKFFSKNTVSIIGVPGDIKVGNENVILREILDEYRTNEREKNLEIRDNIAKSYSCKAAIKAGDRLSNAEMRLLVDQLFATSMPYVCPHGRPIVIKIGLDEFDKRFGRT